MCQDCASCPLPPTDAPTSEGADGSTQVLVNSGQHRGNEQDDGDDDEKLNQAPIPRALLCLATRRVRAASVTLT